MTATAKLKPKRRWLCTRCCAVLVERGQEAWTETPDGRRIDGVLDCPVTKPGTPTTWRGAMPHDIERMEEPA